MNVHFVLSLVLDCSIILIRCRIRWQCLSPKITPTHTRPQLCLKYLQHGYWHIHSLFKHMDLQVKSTVQTSSRLNVYWLSESIQCITCSHVALSHNCLSVKPVSLHSRRCDVTTPVTVLVCTIGKCAILWKKVLHYPVSHVICSEHRERESYGLLHKGTRENVCFCGIPFYPLQVWMCPRLWTAVCRIGWQILQRIASRVPLMAVDI